MSKLVNVGHFFQCTFVLFCFVLSFLSREIAKQLPCTAIKEDLHSINKAVNNKAVSECDLFIIFFL